MINQLDSIDRFRAAMLATIGTAPDRLDTSGKLARFSTNGKPQDKAGYYGLFLHPIAAGFFGDFRTGAYSTWTGESRDHMDKAQWLAVQRKMAAERAKVEQERHQLAEQARIKAVSMWGGAKAASHAHPYLLRKQVQAHGIRQTGNLLLIPLVDIQGNLHSLQTIAPDGAKRFLAGGRKRGMFCLLGGSLEHAGGAIVCEGYATGASLHEAYQRPVIVAFDAGNLLPVAKAYRAAFPFSRLDVCADNDRAKAFNTGVTKAREVVAQVGNVGLMVPDFPDDAPIGLSDFNDLACWMDKRGVAA